MQATYRDLREGEPEEQTSSAPLVSVPHGLNLPRSQREAQSHGPYMSASRGSVCRVNLEGQMETTSPSVKKKVL